MLPGEGVLVVVVVGVELVFAAEPPVPPEEEPDLDGVVLGTTTVTVTLGVVLVATTVPDPPLVLPLPFPVPAGGLNDAYSIVPPVEFPGHDFDVTGLRASVLWGNQRNVYGIDLGD